MLRFLADHNFHQPLLNGVLARDETVDVVLSRNVGVDKFDDPSLLRWAADHGRAILSHDVNTLIGFASDRLLIGLPMAGLVEVNLKNRPSVLIEDLLILIACESSLHDQIVYIPFR